LSRELIFARDQYRCVYCGRVFPIEELTLDHVQPRARAGDRSAGNLVTACRGCNVLKGHRSIAVFLAENPELRANFFQLATGVWKRHLSAVEQELQGLLEGRARRRPP
jgi:5-methylcytosine-specific restriction endonuclease McrA